MYKRFGVQSLPTPKTGKVSYGCIRAIELTNNQRIFYIYIYIFYQNCQNTLKSIKITKTPTKTLKWSKYPWNPKKLLGYP